MLRLKRFRLFMENVLMLRKIFYMANLHKIIVLLLLNLINSILWIWLKRTPLMGHMNNYARINK